MDHDDAAEKSQRDQTTMTAISAIDRTMPGVKPTAALQRDCRAMFVRWRTQPGASCLAARKYGRFDAIKDRLSRVEATGLTA
jgi:hypothetical protein